MKAAEIQQLLPAVFQRTLQPGAPLSAIIDVMESLHAPAETAIAELDRILDPRRTPDAFVPLLARWVDLDRLLANRLVGKEATVQGLMPTGLGRLRELIARAAYLSKWRGTRKGLLAFLQVATGMSDFEISEDVADDEGGIRPFHIRVTCSAAAKTHLDIIREIIESEKPAYVTYELAFATPTETPTHAEDI